PPAAAPAAPSPQVSSPGMQIPRFIPPPPPSADATAAKQRRPPEGHREADAHAKTLKCPECGTLNSPTEWYCEKCGAELSNF
ncbi:MAG TPA: zinc-ribbon domain-containing protein, partial [Myxococcota bacterium]|nr:zinc-ribbon domain-containing protein [Myxococcota bacterium]